MSSSGKRKRAPFTHRPQRVAALVAPLVFAALLCGCGPSVEQQVKPATEPDTTAGTEGNCDAKVEIFISPTGNDANAGTAKAPLKSFDKVLEKVTSLPPDWSSDVVVFVEPGDYELQSTIRLGPEHSGRNGKKLIFKANGGPGSAVLIGGQRLDPSKWQAYRSGIYVRDLGGVESVEMIYENRRKARKARLPNFRQLPDFPATDGDYFKAKKVGRGEPWLTPQPEDIGHDLLQAIQGDLAKGVKHYLVVFGHGNRDWHKWIHPISEIDLGRSRIVVSEPKPILNQRADDHSNRYYVEGGLRFLDAKGEFYFDDRNDRLYYMPYGDIQDSEIIYSTVNNILKIEGAENVVFDGLQFTCSAVLEHTDSSYTWSDPDAAVALESSRSISILNCRFYSIGQSAINLRNSSGNTIIGCAMSYLGQSGMKLEFSDNNEIRDCLIHDIGLRRLYCEGVALHSSRDNTIRHLEICNSARYGITLRARVNKETGLSNRPTTGNVLEYIKMLDVNQDSGDTAGLHMAMINYPSGPNYTNTCNQITIHRSIAQPDITDEWKPTGVYLDHPKAVMNQSLSNIEVTDYDPRYPGYDPKRFKGLYGPDARTSDRERQIYQNRPHNNRSSTKFNCSWSPDFDRKHMEYEKIGLTDTFPREFLRAGSQGTD